jgi:hypothetical protein
MKMKTSCIHSSNTLLSEKFTMNGDNFSNEPSSKSSRAGKKWLAFFYGLGLACGLIFSSWWLAQTFQKPSPVSDSPQPVAATAPSDVLHATGAWGTLMAETIYTEKPAHFRQLSPRR